MDTERGFVVLLLAAVTLLFLYLFLPFVSVVLTAILIAYLLRPLHRRLAPRIGEQLSAVLLLFGAILLVVLPFVVLLSVALSGLRSLLSLLTSSGDGGLEGILELLESTFTTDYDVGSSIQDFVQSGQLGEILRAILDLVGGAANAFIEVTLLLFLSYYLLKDGDDLIAWIRGQVPVDESTMSTLLDQADELLFAAFIGNTSIAIGDGLLVGLGLLLTGISNVLFWTFLAVFLALIPLIGTTVIWIPAAVYLVLIGQTLSGVLLFVWGVVIVGAVDNILRPYVGSSEIGLVPPLYIFGVFSGIALFGFIGIYFGPVVVAMTKILFDTFGESARGNESTI